MAVDAAVASAVMLRRAEQLWPALPAADAEDLLVHGIVREFRSGQALCHEHQVPDRVLFILSGRVKVLGTTAAGREVVLAFRGPGDLVGELAALDDEPRSATMVALEPVKVVAVPLTEFRAFLAQHPAAAFALLQLLAARLRDADRKRIESASAPSIERVASRLLELCDRFGERQGDSVHITLPVTQEELAGWVGTSVESLGRAFQTMRRLGWLETGRRELRVIDVEALRRAAA
jgi:CRP-like cAMP-binding protein